LDGGINLFIFALNNPVSLVDPWGLESGAGHLDWFSRSLGVTGGPPPGVDPGPIPWREYGKAIVETAIVAPIRETKEALQALSDSDLSNLGPTTMITSGAALATLGSELSMKGISIMSTEGPVGWIGGGTITSVGFVSMTVGGWTIYKGWRQLKSVSTKKACEY
jgi:hypothetical protein